MVELVSECLGGFFFLFFGKGVYLVVSVGFVSLFLKISIY